MIGGLRRSCSDTLLLDRNLAVMADGSVVRLCQVQCISVPAASPFPQYLSVRVGLFSQALFRGHYQTYIKIPNWQRIDQRPDPTAGR